jgi:sulfite reductase alpha subunit-like flavoprotein
MSSGGKPEEAPGGKPEETLSEEERKYREKQFDRAEISHVDPSFHPPAVMKVAEWTRRHEPEFPAERARADHRWEQDHPREFWLLDKGNILKDDPKKYRLQRAHLVDFPDPERCPPAIALPVPNMVQVRVVENSRVTPPDHWQDVRFIALQAPAMQKEFVEALKLNLGSMTLSIYPMNYPEDVEELISLMGWEEYADKPLRRPYHRPKNLYLVHNDPTLRELLTHNLDITAVPKRSFIRELTWMTNNEREKERLKELIKSGQQQELYDYTSRPRRTIIEMLRDFPNVKIPFQRVLDLFPIIRPREFSVANGTLEAVTDDKGNPCVILEILAALVEYKTIIRKPRQGLCSRYLKTLRVGTEISVQINRSTSPNLHTHPMYAQRPMIAIATGTGIAPIRAMLQRRRDICLRDRPAPTLLFFGCRNRAADFYFEHEWAQDRYRNWLTVYPAFSRDGIEPDRDATVSATSAASPLPVPMAQAAGDLSIGLSAIYAGAMPSYDVHKNYVQHLIRKHGREVAALLAQRNAYICVCGNAGRMPLSVRAALMDVLVKWEVVKNVEEAEKWLGNPANVTYWQECW